MDVGWLATDQDQHLHLRGGGVSLVVHLAAGRLPVIAYWGADLGGLEGWSLESLLQATRPPTAANGVDRPLPLAVLPEPWTGWTGTPGLSGHRDGQAWSTKFTTTSAQNVAGLSSGGCVDVQAVDSDAELELRLILEVLPTGLIRTRASVRNLAPGAFTIDGLLLALPVPGEANEVLDHAGRWAAERQPQRRPFGVGTHLREGRHGRTGADATLVLTAGEPGFGFRSGQVWGVHTAWSGNHRTQAERTFTGERYLGGGELLLPGEVRLAQGQSYMSPWLYGSYGNGLDEMAARFHGHLRSRPQHPKTARPVVLNVWEAVYFDHDLARLKHLADLAAGVGVERFVLDDGWFRHRRDDTAGLGDWYVDETVWPLGLRPLADHVRSHGMQFGLWFEPEMINPDSDTARAHPEWILQVPGRLPTEARHQQVLDLDHPEAFAYVLQRVVTVLHEAGVEYVKWDHNRDLVDAGSTRTQQAGVHRQTLAAYRLMDEVKSRCPELEIESCSSGGARIDLEVLRRTDRVWASDCNDAHERQLIQRWTAQLLPPELVGSHIGSNRDHTTGRRLELSFRAVTALFGHLGIEWDLASAESRDLEELTMWVELYKQHRTLIHTGTTVRGDTDGRGMWLNGVVSPLKDEALFAISCRERPITWPPGLFLLPGLDPDRVYDVSGIGPGMGKDPRMVPPWWTAPLRVPGSVLLHSGIQVPALNPDTAVLLHLVDVSE